MIRKNLPKSRFLQIGGIVFNISYCPVASKRQAVVLKPRFFRFAGNFLNIARNGITRQGRAQFGKKHKPFSRWHFEVGRSVNTVELVQVIWDNSEICKLFKEIVKCLENVIDIPEQDRLTEHRDSGVNKTADRIGNLVGQFIRMIDVQDDINGPARRIEAITYQ